MAEISITTNCLPAYPRKPRSAVGKFARFGKTCGIAAELTPNHFAIVAAYCSIEVVGTSTPRRSTVGRSSMSSFVIIVPTVFWVVSRIGVFSQNYSSSFGQ